MLTSQKDNLANVPIFVSAISAEDRLKQERMKDVLLLLEQLVEREEATVKRILDCLYDVGSLNLINKKFRARPLNRLMKTIAKLTRPTFRLVALYWFKRNCPKLITDWLATKVQF
jgi:hypothetical protein